MRSIRLRRNNTFRLHCSLIYLRSDYETHEINHHVYIICAKQREITTQIQAMAPVCFGMMALHVLVPNQHHHTDTTLRIAPQANRTRCTYSPSINYNLPSSSSTKLDAGLHNRSLHSNNLQPHPNRQLERQHHLAAATNAHYRDGLPIGRSTRLQIHGKQHHYPAHSSRIRLGRC